MLACFFKLVKLPTISHYFGQAEPLSEIGELNGVSVKEIQLCSLSNKKDGTGGRLALETRAPSRKLCRNTLKGYCVRATSRRSAFSLLSLKL